jgi:hypothetical protein
MKLFRGFRDDRFALTTPQNPAIEVRRYAELVQAAQQERQNQPAPAQIPATQQQAEPILIGSAPLLENDVNHRKQSPATHSNRWFFGRFRRQVP